LQSWCKYSIQGNPKKIFTDLKKREQEGLIIPNIKEAKVEVWNRKAQYHSFDLKDNQS
jgi:hypothetical protein